MNEEEFKSHWPKLKAEAKKRWPKLTDDEIETIDGNMSHLITTLQSKYFFVQEETEQEIEKLLLSVENK